MFNEQNFAELLELCTKLQGKFMLTMYPDNIIQQYADKTGWIIHKVVRQVSACKAESRRSQEEWMICNYGV
jgi:DNA adenine methylase